MYALAGYNPTAEEVIAAFKLYVQEEARKYEQEFPNELYLAWHRLYDIPIPESQVADTPAQAGPDFTSADVSKAQDLFARISPYLVEARPERF